MPVKLLTSGGGGVNLVPSSSIASDQTMYLPTSGTSGGTVLCTDSSGNLGIGVTPSAWGGRPAIEMSNSGAAYIMNNGTGAVVLGTNHYYTGTQKIYKNNGYATEYATYSGTHAWFTAPSGTAGNAITFTQAMTLDSSGNLLVGATSAQGDGFTTNGSGAIWQKSVGYAVWKLTPYTGNYYFNVGGLDKATINGSTGAYTALSDVNKKLNIEDSTKGLSTILQLRPVVYEMVDGNGVQEMGFIAQEVAEHLPEAYVEQEGSGGQFIGLTDRPIIATLVKAIQEQQAIIESLTQRIEALEYTKQGE